MCVCVCDDDDGIRAYTLWHTRLGLKMSSAKYTKYAMCVCVCVCGKEFCAFHHTGIMRERKKNSMDTTENRNGVVSTLPNKKVNLHNTL